MASSPPSQPSSANSDVPDAQTALSPPPILQSDQPSPSASASNSHARAPPTSADSASEQQPILQPATRSPQFRKKRVGRPAISRSERKKLKRMSLPEYVHALFADSKECRVSISIPIHECTESSIFCHVHPSLARHLKDFPVLHNFVTEMEKRSTKKYGKIITFLFPRVVLQVSRRIPFPSQCWLPTASAPDFGERTTAILGSARN